MVTGGLGRPDVDKLARSGIDGPDRLAEIIARIDRLDRLDVIRLTDLKFPLNNKVN